ncbi:MAG: hypothetical protein HY290_17410 [Planctomycetia bacterium]|nr:hypothetical protein [Planctomycetia bacterium]
MSRTKVDLKDPAFAAFLAFLVPGLGHFYQRRMFKALLYSACILGTFFTGLRIGHGQVVYFHWKQADNRTYAYLCQVWAGLPALPALAQSHLLRSKEAFDANYVSNEFSGPFQGNLLDAKGNVIGEISGTVEIRPDRNETANNRPAWSGTIRGTLKTPAGTRNIEGEVRRGGDHERWVLDPAVAPWPVRRVFGRFDETSDGGGAPVRGRIEGGIPRSLWDSYEAPLQDPRPSDSGSDASDLDRAHRELGGRFELGVVYTMIAGLLNILAIYDAYEGPAYEDEEDDEKTDTPPPDAGPEKT